MKHLQILRMTWKRSHETQGRHPIHRHDKKVIHCQTSHVPQETASLHSFQRHWWQMDLFHLARKWMICLMSIHDDPVSAADVIGRVTFSTSCLWCRSNQNITSHTGDDHECISGKNMHKDTCDQTICTILNNPKEVYLFLQEMHFADLQSNCHHFFMFW